MILEKIVRQANVRLILLFGSYAKFSAKESSDIDIYLATKNSKIKRELFDIDNRISVEIGNFNRKSHLGKEIIKHHIILKGLEEFYEKNKIFN